MPELPEVETVVRTLEHQINGRTIIDCKVLWANIIARGSSQEFENKIKNQKFEGFSRRGKFLIFTLTDYVLIVHLRMEGKFYVYNETTTPDKHTHIVFNLDKGQLHYNDVRKFGKFYLYEKGEELSCLNKLGYEPFSSDLTAEYLKEYCKNKSTPIKSQLLDQGMIAGIGNIYANEICYDIRVAPNWPSCFISLNKWQEIIDSTQKILSEAIKEGGTTIRSYTSSLGVTGLFQQNLYVHSRDTQQCRNCQDTIVKKTLNGRGTYYCPTCQRSKPLYVAITGTIGSGKSTVTNMFKDLGYPTISCDEVNASLLEQNYIKEGLADIFNCAIEEVTKGYISKRIFNDEALKQKVENYLHNEIYQKILSFYNENLDARIVFVEVPLLFETDWYKRFDYNIVVSATKEVVLERLKSSRNMSEEDINKFLSNQISNTDKENKADLVIFNNGSASTLACLVEKAEKNIVKLLR